MNFWVFGTSIIGYFCLLFLMYVMYKKYTLLLINLAQEHSKSIYMKDLGLVSKKRFVASVESTSKDLTNGSLAVFALRLLDSDGESARLEGKLLSDVVLRIRSAIRSTDEVYQKSDSDFIIMFSRHSSHSGAKTVAQRIISYFDNPLLDDNGVSHLFSCHIGVDSPQPLVLKNRENQVDSLIDNAVSSLEKALTSASHVVVHSDSQSHYAPVISIQDIQYSFQANHFYLVYQPQLDIVRNRATGVEVLLRWNHPQYGYISPIDFIPLMERSKLIIPVGYWVLRQSCLDFVSWGRDDITVSVNVSAVQFLQDDFVKQVMTICEETGINPHLLRLELTETLAVGDLVSAKKKVDSLLSHGVRIVIDDFGKGHSALMYLKSFPIDAIKIDSHFVWDIGKSVHGEAIIKTIVNMSNDLGYQTIAEGVETLEQVIFLESIGVSCLQGYMISHPVSEKDFIANLDQHSYSRSYSTIA